MQREHLAHQQAFLVPADFRETNDLEHVLPILLDGLLVPPFSKKRVVLMQLGEVIDVQSKRESHREEQNQALSQRKHAARLPLLQVREEGQDRDGDEQHEYDARMQEDEDQGHHTVEKLRDWGEELSEE